MKIRIPHPDWCAQGHHCNLNEHRSEPIRWQTPYGAVVATIAQYLNRRTSYLDLRISVAIDANETTARRQAAALADAIDHTIRAALAANRVDQLGTVQNRTRP